MAERIPCRCLLAEAFPDMHQTVAEYVASLPDDQRAEDAVYQARLAQCQACDSLRDGTCVFCGCYVEARAAKRAQRCPSVPPKWKNE